MLGEIDIEEHPTMQNRDERECLATIDAVDPAAKRLDLAIQLFLGDDLKQAVRNPNAPAAELRNGDRLGQQLVAHLRISFRKGR
jgi:hypothetical protein